MFCQKAKFLQVHKSYYMKKKKKKKGGDGRKTKRGRKTKIDYSALLDCLFNSGLGHKQLREALMKNYYKLNKICAAATGDVLAKLKAGNPRMEQGKTFSNSMPFKKLHTAYMSSAYKK